MINNISTEERIDNYLLGKMNSSECSQFESDLESDSALREEYESQKEVANGVQRVALRQFLAECEQKRTTAHAVEFVGLGESMKSISDKIKIFASSGRRLAWSLSAVAAMVVAVVGLSNYLSISNSLQSFSVMAYNQTQAPIARDGNQLDALLESAYTSIGNNQLDVAAANIGEAFSLIENEMAKPVATEEDAYNRQILQIKKQDAEWYSVLVLLKQGKVLKSRMKLKAIVEAGGIYTEEAQNILDDIYHSK